MDRKLDFATVPALSAPGAWDEVFQKGGFDYAIHNAGPMPNDDRAKDSEKDFLALVVAG
jgi:hypothetical protein